MYNWKIFKYKFYKNKWGEIHRLPLVFPGQLVIFIETSNWNKLQTL